VAAATDALLDGWDRQQAAYIADREGRFAIMLELLARVCGEAPVVVDAACGPGSLSLRVLERFPAARVVALDVDPLLLDVARAALAPYGERATVLTADLTTPDWPDAVRAVLGGARPDAFVSTTALHWLLPGALVAVYAAAAGLLAPGGVLLNGDHFRFDDGHPTLARVAAEHDAATQAQAHAAGAQTWDAWWAEASARPGGAALAAERERVFADRPAPPSTTIGFHVAALVQAGFAEAAPVWQLLDDYVVFGRTAEVG
jgi:trans-aconitate methyltransferase